MRIYSKIDIGKERSLNQDAFFAGEISDDIAFAVVCDGMGGANAGEILTIERRMEKTPNLLGVFSRLGLTLGIKRVIMPLKVKPFT